jgi:SAM-dependent methyltransferase
VDSTVKPTKSTAGVDLARHAFYEAEPQHRFLSMDELQQMDREFPPKPASRVLGSRLRNAGEQRATHVLNALGNASSCRILELGAGEGTVALAIAESGHEAFAIDTRDEFDSRVRASAVICRTMDATDLEYADGYFDCAYSYDVFEHVGDPGMALAEAIRVVRPGGTIYLSFGPLYNSAQGLHSHRVLHVPYRQHLFSKSTLDRYAESTGRGRISYKNVNQWSLKQFRVLWGDVSHLTRVVSYKEESNTDFVGLIQRYAEHFRTQVDSIDELLVARIELRLQKQ